MSRVVRASKFRHVFGNPPKKENTYDGLKPSRSAWDSNKVACSTKFVGLIWDAQGGGSFAVLDVNKKGKLGQIPLVCGHSGDVLDIEFSPFNDNLVASVSEDCYGKLWTIPDGGLTSNMTDPVQSLSGHRRKVGTLNWNPVASNILATTANDNTVKIWDVETGSAALTMEALTDICQSSTWNYNGSLLYTTSKDKKLKVIDPRGGQVVSEVEAHPGIKGMRVCSLGRQNKIFTFGFSKTSERQYSLWDPSNLSNPIHSENIDTASGILMPFYDDDTNVLFLAGKGDGNIRYFELVDEAPYIYYLTEFKSSTPQRGMGMYPKLGMDLASCEIARLFKVAANAVEPISFCVPRKSDIFQDDLYPPTFSGQPALNASQWLGGSNAEIKRIEIKPGMTIPSAGTTTEFKSAPAAAGGDDVASLKARIAQLEREVAEKDRLIAQLRG